MPYLSHFFWPPANPKQDFINPDQNVINAIYAYCAEKRSVGNRFANKESYIAIPLGANLTLALLVILSNKNVIRSVELFLVELERVDLSDTSEFLDLAFDYVKTFNFLSGVFLSGIAKAIPIPWNTLFATTTVATTIGMLTFWYQYNTNPVLSRDELMLRFGEFGGHFEDHLEYSNIINCRDLNALENIAKRLESTSSIAPQLVAN